MRMVVRLIAAVLLVALPAAAAAQDEAPASYVALGDSFASGEGARSDTFLPGTSFPDPATAGRSSTGCHRSTTSWAFRVQARIGAPAVTFVACSGADLADLTAPNDQFAAVGEVEPPQIDAVTSCDDARDPVDRRERRRVRAGPRRLPLPSRGHPGNAGCRRYRDRPPGASPRAGLRGLDTAPRRRLRQRSRPGWPPGGRLVVVGLSAPLRRVADGRTRPTPPAGGPACRLGVTPLKTPVRIARLDARFLNGLAGDIDAAIARRRGAAPAPGSSLAGASTTVTFVPSDPAFGGHRLCSRSPWMNALRLTSGGTPKRISFHPNPKGQAAYARAVTAALP